MSRLSHQFRLAALLDALKGALRRSRNLAELGRLDPHMMDDIGIAEATRRRMLGAA